MLACLIFAHAACWGLAKRERACHGFLMSKKPLLLLLAGLFVCSVQVGAQDAADTTERAGEFAGPSRFWQATLGGGHFMVALDRIASVSRHKYVLDGALIIDEVTVDTVGQALARFYFISPITDETPGNTVSDVAKRGRELAEKVAQRTGGELQDMVMKKYPDTSHAKSIEYRILSETELSSLYNSVRSAWETGRGRKFTAK
jgi:hypothetical protein